MQLLLDKGAAVNAANENGDTPLILAAAFYGNKESAQLLLDKGANVNAANKSGDTALISAVRHDDRERFDLHEIVQLLVDRNANLDKKGSDGRTAFELACLGSRSYRNVEILREAIRAANNAGARQQPPKI